MKEPFSEEILSAYLDGEISPDERARVERRLERDPRAREQVEDFRRLSQIFAGLPRTELPASFAGEVLQLAERRMLIPEGSVRPARGRASRWVLGAAASMAAAAALLLIIQAIAPDHNGPAIADRGGFPRPMQNGRDAAAPDIAKGSDGAFFDREGAGTRPSTTAAGEPAAAPVVSGVGGFGGRGGLPGLSDGTNESHETDPRLAEFGEKIQEINDSEDPENIVSAVTVYVVDRAEGLVLLQRSLEASNVQPEGERERSEKEKADTIYVVAEPEQIITAFSKMLDREHPELRVEVEAPIKVATLDRQTQQKFDDLMRDLSGPHAAARELEKADIKRRNKADDGENEKPVVEPRKGAAKPEGAGELKSQAKSAKSSEDRRESSNPREQAAQSQDAPADAKNESEGMRGPAGAATGRQFVGRAPPELEQRDQTARKNSGDSRRSAETGKSAARDASDRAKDQQPLAGNRLAARSPLVRVLIRVASDSPPAPDRPAATKSAP
jgi:hypothetical protein